MILFLIFCNKAKLKNLAADFVGNSERQSIQLALHIGVVTNWPFLIINPINNTLSSNFKTCHYNTNILKPLFVMQCI